MEWFRESVSQMLKGAYCFSFLLTMALESSSLKSAARVRL